MQIMQSRYEFEESHDRGGLNIPSVRRRSLSPHRKVERRRRMSVGERRNGFVAERDCDWYLNAERKINPGSLSLRRVQENRYFQDSTASTKHRAGMDVGYDREIRLKQVQEHDAHCYSHRVSRENEPNRFCDLNEARLTNKKHGLRSDAKLKGMQLEAPPLGYTSNVREFDIHLPNSSHGVGMDYHDRENPRHGQFTSMNDAPTSSFYDRTEMPGLNLTNASPRLLFTKAKDHLRISSPCREFTNQYDEYVPCDLSNERSMDFELQEHVDFGKKNRKPPPAIGYTDGAYKKREGFSQAPPYSKFMRTDSVGFSKSHKAIDDYVHDHAHRLASSSTRMDFGCAPVSHKEHENIRDYRIFNKISSTERTNDNIRRNSIMDSSTLHIQDDANNVVSKISSHVPRDSREYLGIKNPRSEFQYISSVDSRSSHSCAQGGHFVDLAPDYVFDGEKMKHVQAERYNDFYEHTNHNGMGDVSIERRKLIELPSFNEPSMKRGYLMEVDDGSRTKGFGHFYDSEAWSYEDLNTLPIPESCDNENRKRSARTYHGHYGTNLTDGGFLYPQPTVALAKMHSHKFYNQNLKFKKIKSRLSYSRPSTSYQVADIPTKVSEGKGIGAKILESDPAKGTEEFKQLQDQAFLEYSKELNLTSATQKNFKQQGKPNSMFCIVCNKSSKEFADTLGLAKHALMCKKSGMRVKHLGFHKALCVLMGWSTNVPQNPVTWVPEILSAAEACAQQEDLILWPPIILIHNVSMANNNPKQQKVVSVETVENFLRGKGLIVGKMKICVGRPADQSVMVVRFLGTFTGLGNAEKLHKHFVENKHGREEFEREASGGGSNPQGDNLEEQLLYGYMGIAADVDKLNFNTKKWISIKSRKEIQALADAPVKTDDLN